jgi:peptide/nickel transport system permease protein
MSRQLWTFILLRLLQSFLVVLVVVSVVFVVTRVIGDPVTIMAPIDATQQDIQRIKQSYGLNDPIYQQYVRFIWDTARLHMGTSFRTRQPAVKEVQARLGATKRGTVVDLLARIFALIGQAMPNFWLGLMLILLFSVRLGWLPTGGAGGLRHLVLPAVTLGAATCASVVRLTRSGMLDVLGSDFIRTARAKGLSEFRVLTRHAVRHALVPVVTIMGIQAGRVIAGTIVVETVFAWPGIGRLMIQSINSADYPVVQVGVLFIATSIVLANFVVDICYSIIDPRIRIAT